MKIIFLVSTMGPGGAERVAASLCNEWSRRKHSVHLIHTYSGNCDKFYKLNESIDVVCLSELVGLRNKSIYSRLLRLLTIRKIIKKLNADVVISFLPNVNVATILLTRFTGIPVVVSERRDPSSQPMSILWEMACRLFYRFASAIVVQTEVVRSDIGKFYPRLKKVACIPNPLPSDLLLLQLNKNTGHRKVLLSLGRLSPEKQVDHIIRCFSKLATECREWDLHVYGDGPSRQELDRLTASLNLNDRILFKGRSSDPLGVMSQADAFVMTSRFEGFPNALLESMAMGLPCICYDCPSGPRDICRHGADALLIPPQDEEQLLHQMSQLLNDKKLRKDLGERAKASVIERYKPEVILRQWDALFVGLGLKVDIQ